MLPLIPLTTGLGGRACDAHSIDVSWPCFLHMEVQINCQEGCCLPESGQDLKQEQRDKDHFGKRAQGKRVGNPAARQPVFQDWGLHQCGRGGVGVPLGVHTQTCPFGFVPEEDLAALGGNSHECAQEEYKWELSRKDGFPLLPFNQTL